ncbi:MAG: hypothetical protein D6731_04695 [Planctomycetota bacterium]|nr:MAG: hypothetical protein D6731_04695 [Planctomycetota bacterium]
MRRLLPVLCSLALVSGVALGAPPEAFQLRRAPCVRGERWEVVTSTRVERDPRTTSPQLLAHGGEFTETTSRVRYALLDAGAGDRVRLEVAQAAQDLVACIGGRRVRETEPPRRAVLEGPARELLPGEVGPVSLLARGRVRVGEVWTSEATLPVGGVALVPVRLRTAVRAARREGKRALLRVTIQGRGQAVAPDGGRVEVELRGVLEVDPAAVDRPERATLVYRVAVRGGGGPPVATRTTVRVETRPLPGPQGAPAVVAESARGGLEGDRAR